MAGSQGKKYGKRLGIAGKRKQKDKSSISTIEPIWEELALDGESA